MINRSRVLEQGPWLKQALLSELSNYNIPHFVLERVASECGSEFQRKGKTSAVLESLNESALTRLHKIFVLWEDDRDGEFSDYRLAVFVFTKVHSEVMFDQKIRGRSGEIHKVKLVALGDQGITAVGQNKSKGRMVSLLELRRFNRMVKDIANSKDGQGLISAFYGSSVGYEKGFREAFANNIETKSYPNKYGYAIPKTISLLEFRDKSTQEIFSAPF